MTEPLRLHVIQGGRTDQPAKRAQPRKPEQPAKPEQSAKPEQPAKPEPLWREVLGEQLRELRRQHRESLAETAGRAGISPQYLSEVERGLKEPSSEMIAAVAGALGTTLGGLAESVAFDLRARREAALVATRQAWVARRDLAAHQDLVAHQDLAARQDLAVRRTSATRRSAGGPVMLALAA